MIKVEDFYPIWNEMHVKNIPLGADERNKVMADWLESQILAAKKAYYETENPLYDDQTYDKLEDYLKAIRPESKILEKVGA